MRPEPLGRAGGALGYWLRRQEAVAHNLANAETPGFQATRIFAQEGAGGAPVASSRIDTRSGPLAQTRNPLDIAVGAATYLVVEGEAGERLVRGGAFRLEESGRIVDGSGRPLLGEDGPLLLPPGPVDIDSAGNVRVGEQLVGRLRVERAPAGVELEREAAGSWIPAAVRESVADGERGLRQGFLEGSNVSTLDSLVEMITVQRAFNSIQNSIRTLDGVQDRIANDIGRVG